MAEKEKKANGVEGKYKLYLGAFYKVNAKYRLIAEGKFTSSVHVIEPGISYHPFLTAKKIILADGVANTCKLSNFECRSADGNEIYVDLQWNEYVIDPMKLYKGSQNPGEELNGILSQGFKAFINTKNYAELSSYSFDLNSTEPSIVALKTKLDDFKNRCGIEVRNVTIPDVKLTEAQKKANEAKAKAKAEMDAERERALGRKEIAAIDRETQKIKGDALGKELAATKKALGAETEDIIDLKKTEMMSRNQNATFVVGNNGGVMPTIAVNGAYNPYSQPTAQTDENNLEQTNGRTR